MPSKYIVLNGPPKSGKSSAAHWLSRAIKELHRQQGQQVLMQVDAFAAPMKHFIATALAERYGDMDKDKMRPELNGYSAREFLIHMSEHYMKERYGEDVFARLLVYRNLKHVPAPDYVVIDDGGFAVEKMALTKPYIIRVTRPGCDYSKDSRHYWDDPSFTLVNDADYDTLYMRVTTIARGIVDGSLKPSV